MALQPFGQVGDRVEDAVRMDGGAVELLLAELARAHEDGLEPALLGPVDVRLEVVADHPAALGVRVQCLQRRLEVGEARLAEECRLDLRRVLEPGHERAGVEERSPARLPPPVSMQAVELRARFELGERTGEIHVAEHLVRLVRLVGSADEDGVSVLADELDSLEVVDDPRHRQRKDPAACEGPRRGNRSRLKLVLLEIDSQPLELEGEILASAGRVIGDKAQAVAGLAQILDRLRGTWNSAPRDLEHALDVQQNGRHGRRVYSGDALGEPPPVGDRAAVLALERTGRPARSEDRIESRGGLRRRDVERTHGATEEPGDRARRAGSARSRAGRAEPVAEPGAGRRAAGRAAPSRAPRRAAPEADEADRGLAGTAAGAEAPPRRGQATTARALRKLPRRARRAWPPRRSCRDPRRTALCSEPSRSRPSALRGCW